VKVEDRRWRTNACLDAVDDPEAPALVDLTNVAGVDPTLVVDGLPRVLLVFKDDTPSVGILPSIQT
jgi:hypothetical protein